jgi:hypothetical protein
MYYQPDSLINAAEVEEKVRGNAYLNLLYANKQFTVGARYEFYLFPLVDFEQIGYKGQGITYFFADYKNDFIQVTAGTFYEQFGTDLLFVLTKIVLSDRQQFARHPYQNHPLSRNFHQRNLGN